MKKTKLAAAVELGRRGGLKGGPARAEKLSSKQRKKIASFAAAVRWAETPELKAQIKQSYDDYRKGNYRSIDEFMAELEKEIET